MKKEHGQGLVEMALILPFLLVLIVGLIEAGFALNRQLVVVNAAREGARFGAYGANADDIYTQTMLSTSQMFDFTEENAVIVVINAQTDGDGTGFEKWTEIIHPPEAEAPHVTPDKVLEQLNKEGNASNLKLVIVDVRYDHESVLGFPLVGALADRIPIGSWTVMRIHPTSKDLQQKICALPITLPIKDVWDLSNGDVVGPLRLGEREGRFGWVFWQPYESGVGGEEILARNLRDRCQAQSFLDVCTGSTDLSIGSWVWANTEEMVVDEELEELIGVYYPVPVWDEFASCSEISWRCSRCWPGMRMIHITEFALIEIVDVGLVLDELAITFVFHGFYVGTE